MSALSIKLFNIVEVPEGSALMDRQSVNGLNLETAMFGYTLAPQVLDAVMRLEQKEFKTFREEFLDTLGKIKGAEKKYNRLFQKFPYSTPDARDYLEQRIIGDLANRLGFSLGGNLCKDGVI